MKTLDYDDILKKNMINVLIDILNNFKQNNIYGDKSLYITFITKSKGVVIPQWLLSKYPEEMTILLQYEYYDLLIAKNYFSVTLSFSNIKINLKIKYDSIISFADPLANFGLILKKNKMKKMKKNKLEKNVSFKNNVIDFKNYKKLI